MIMASTIATIRQIAAFNPGSAPGDIVTKVNSCLQENNEDNMFTTMFFAIYNVKTGQLQYCNAGHCSPSIISPDGVVRELPESKNTIVGIVPDYPFMTEEVQIGLHEIIFLYTDGVTDSNANSGEGFGKERLNEILANLADCAASEVIEQMTDTMKRCNSNYQQDDITMLAFRRE